MAKKKNKPTAKLTPKQRNFVALFPAIAAGAITVEDAMKKAGYSDSTARQQKRTVDSVRHNSAMQEALRKAGVTEERIALKIRKGMDSLTSSFNYTKLAAELIDGFPSKKIDINPNPISYDDIEDEPKAKTPEEARKMAEGK